MAWPPASPGNQASRMAGQWRSIQLMEAVRPVMRTTMTGLPVLESACTRSFWNPGRVEAGARLAFADGAVGIAYADDDGVAVGGLGDGIGDQGGVIAGGGLGKNFGFGPAGVSGGGALGVNNFGVRDGGFDAIKEGLDRAGDGAIAVVRGFGDGGSGAGDEDAAEGFGEGKRVVLVFE